MVVLPKLLRVVFGWIVFAFICARGSFPRPR
jgi:hypothetical protein